MSFAKLKMSFSKLREHECKLWRMKSGVPVSGRVSRLCVGYNEAWTIKLTPARDFRRLVSPHLRGMDIFNCVVTAINSWWKGSLMNEIFTWRMEFPIHFWTTLWVLLGPLLDWTWQYCNEAWKICRPVPPPLLQPLRKIAIVTGSTWYLMRDNLEETSISIKLSMCCVVSLTDTIHNTLEWSEILEFLGTERLEILVFQIFIEKISKY